MMKRQPDLRTECKETLSRALARMGAEMGAQLSSVGKAFAQTAARWFEAMVGTLKDHHAATGNPYFAWEAYRLARRQGVDVPGWVLAYFDRAGDRLLDEAEADRNAAAIAGALGMGARPRRTYARYIDKTWLDCGIYVRLAMQDGAQESYAVLMVAEMKGLSPATVRRHFKAYEKAVMTQ